MGIVGRLPLASGLLTGKLNKESLFAESDHRNFNRDGAAFNVGETFAGLPFETGVELAQELQALAPESMSLSQLALRWILDAPEVTAIIPGASRASQVEANCASSDLPPLGEELHRALGDFYERRVKEHIRGPY